MDQKNEQKAPLRIKNLAELKRYIRPGTELVATSHSKHPALVGLVRVVTEVQTNAYYSVVKDQPIHQYSTCNYGKGFRSDFEKASNYLFEGTTIKVLDRRSGDGSVLYEMELYPGECLIPGQKSDMEENEEIREDGCEIKQEGMSMTLTKSVSRFGRNTLDSLRALQELQVLGVDVYFEKEHLWLHDRQMQVLMTSYVAFAQAESEGASQSIRWGIKEGFRSGRSGYAEFVCFGYKQDDNGKLVIDEPDAKIVREIFEMRADGKSLGAISDWLYEQGVFSPTGKRRWSRETISKLLKNEKYVGDVLLQKTFVKDLFSGKQVKNVGERERFLYQDHHPAIISRELFDKVNR